MGWGLVTDTFVNEWFCERIVLRLVSFMQELRIKYRTNKRRIYDIDSIAEEIRFPVKTYLISRP